MEENEDIKRIKKGFTKFGLGNFKGFRDIQEIELAPITLVFGQNSGGKTSLLQSILSLSQSFYEIEKGKFQLSGNKIDAGTFQTVLNNKSKKKEIIIESQNEYRTLPPHLIEEAYYIDTFKPIVNSKIRFYINSLQPYSFNFILRLEIIFSDYLEGYNLIFDRCDESYVQLENNYMRDYYDPLFMNNKIPSSTYQLNRDSFANLREITRKCYEHLSDGFRTIKDIKKKGDWYNKKQKQFRLTFGIGLSELGRRYREIDNKLLTLIKYAAISSGFIFLENKNRFYSNSYVVKELETFRKTKGVQNVFKILKESSLDLFEASLEAYDYKSCTIKLDINLFRSPLPRRFQRSQDSSNSLDRLVGNIRFVSSYKNLRDSFYKNNVFSKIEDLKDKYLKKLANFDNHESEINKKLLEKYSLIKNKIEEINFKISNCERLLFKILNLFEGEYSTVKNRQILRDYLLDFPFHEIDELDDINNLDKEIDEFKFLILKDDITDTSFKSLWDLEPLKNLIDQIKEFKEIHNNILRKNKIRKVVLARNYNSTKDLDLIYFKKQITSIFNLGYYFRRVTKNIQVSLKDRLILKFLENKQLNKSISRGLLYSNFSWLISAGSEVDDPFDQDEVETRERELSNFIDSKYPNIYWYEMDEVFQDISFLENTKHLMPSPFTTQTIVSSRLNYEVIHLGPSRPGAKRFYTVSDIENAAPEDVAFFLKLYKNNNKVNDLSIKDLNKYLESLDILKTVKPAKSNDSRYDFESILVSRNDNEEPVNLADTGYGLSQLFPIIINAVTRKVNTILVQQPETHLHPRLQAEVGSILVDSIIGLENDKDQNFNRKYWLVETHSEIMLLRILKRIRNGDFNHNNLRVYYIDQNKEKGSVIKRMHVSKEGELITQWPKGFFSNDIDELFDI